MTGVWVTRPDPFGAATTHNLTQAGYRVLHAPLLFYERLEPFPFLFRHREERSDVAIQSPSFQQEDWIAALPTVARNDAVWGVFGASVSDPFSCGVLTSRMVVRALSEERAGIELLLTLPCYCVGAQTAEAARAFGFSVVHVGQGDAKALAERILADGHTHALHLCGEDHGPEPSQTLTAGGCRLQQIPLYRMRTASTLPQDVLDPLQRGAIQAVLFYSPRTASCFVRCMQTVRLEACCRSLIAVGLSEAVRAELDGIAFQAVVASASPSEESLLACLKDVCPP